MSITVAEALKIGALRQCKLLAGSRSTDNIINFVDSMEVPDITPWLKSNELLVTTGYSIKDDHDALVRLIESLKQVKAAGLAIKSRYMGQIPQDIIKLAEKLSLPLIEIPEDVPFIQITHPLMKAIASRQTCNLEFSESVHRELTKVELEGNGFEDIAKTLYGLIGNAVLITDRYFKILAVSGPISADELPAEPFPDGKDIGRKLKIPYPKSFEMQMANGTERMKIEGCSWSFCYRPARAKDKVYGFIFAIEHDKHLKDLELIALEHATTTTCLEFVKQELVSEQLRMVEHDFFADLLLGTVQDKLDAQHRAKLLGWPQSPWSMIIVDIDDFSARISDMDEASIQALKEEVKDIMLFALADIRDSFVLLSMSDSFIFLFSEKAVKGERTFEKLISAAKKRVLDQKGFSMSAGISNNIDGVMGIPEGHKQAQTALKIARLVNGAGSVGHFGRLALERALLDLSGSESFRQYYKSVLGKIAKYDEENDGELMKSLRALIDNMGMKSQAAQALYIHRNTLSYRIKQIETMSGLDLSRAGDLTALAILLKVKPFV